MTTLKEKRQREVDRITNVAHVEADSLFDGDIAKGFLFWAAGVHLHQSEDDPTEEGLLESITDGKDDLELDAYHIDDSSRTVYLFQSKYRSNPGTVKMNDLASFLDVPNKLTTPKILADVSNEGILELAPRFRRCIQDGYEIQLVYLTTLRATKPTQSWMDAWADEPLTLQVAGTHYDVPHSATMLDVRNLLQIVESVSDQQEVEHTLSVRTGEFHQASSGNFKCLIATLSLKELAVTFDRFRYAMFRHNPRGPLGSVAVNKEIKGTLADPTKRDWFQLMNNGLSAVCAAFTDPVVKSDSAVVRIRDFQIVNGCQTTYTVWDHWRRGGELGEASVTLKLVEDPSSQLRHTISSASNKQSQMKDWDFLFDESEQQRLQKEFATLSPPMFYELRRGEYKFIAPSEKADRVTIKDIAQANWAFIGKPGEAKDRVREIPRSQHQPTGPYREVFTPDVEAERLRLPWLAYKRVQDEWKKHAGQTDERGDFREHGRLHILWLVGRGLVISRHYSDYRSMSLSRVKQLTSSMDQWFPSLHDIAVDAVSYVVDVEGALAEANNQRLSLRQLFRSASNYDRFVKRHDELLKKSVTV